MLVKMKEKKSLVQFYVSTTIKDKLKKVADHERMSISCFVRRVVEESLEKYTHLEKINEQ